MFLLQTNGLYILVDFLSEKIQQDEWSNLAAVGNIYVFILLIVISIIIFIKFVDIADI
jgi:hypothetical protein